MFVPESRRIYGAQKWSDILPFKIGAILGGRTGRKSATVSICYLLE